MLVRRFGLMGLALVLALALTGCVPLSAAPAAGSGTGSPSGPDYPQLPASSVDATENLANRAEMEAHLAEVLPRLKLPPGSTAGTAIAQWDYSASRVPTAGASPWLGTVQVSTPYYYIPVLVDGEWIETLTSQKYGGRWRVWRERSSNEAIEQAHDMLAAHFETKAFESRVTDGWLLGRSAGEVVGVPVWIRLDHREGKPPAVAITDMKALRWWLDHPYGPAPR